MTEILTTSRVNSLFLRNHYSLRAIACSRLSDSGEEAKVKGTRYLGGAFYFRVRAFSVQQTGPSRTLEQAIRAMHSSCSPCRTRYVNSLLVKSKLSSRAIAHVHLAGLLLSLYFIVTKT